MVLARTGTAPAGSNDVVAALRERVDGEVRFDDGSRAAYSTDASNFRQVPTGVVLPRTIEAAVEAAAGCREHDLPIVNRGGGTSLAGQCTNEAVVLDFSKYCHRVVSCCGPRRQLRVHRRTRRGQSGAGRAGHGAAHPRGR
jgi:FAD/FMN-containing dehydrogenase